MIILLGVCLYVELEVDRHSLLMLIAKRFEKVFCMSKERERKC